MWAKQRAEALTQLTYKIFSEDVVKFSFLPSAQTSFIDYFPADFTADWESSLNPGWHYLPPATGLTEANVVILTAHGSDLSSVIWELRQVLQPEALVLVWLWDNHLNQVGNLQTVVAADFVFPSHYYAADYLSSPAACLTAHVPACCGQWTRTEIMAYFAASPTVERSDKLLANYVDYPFSGRTHVLQLLQAQAPEVEVLLMQPQDRSRYFSKSRRDRFQEWMESKSTLILPVDRDLSTRVFDALVAGQILVVPEFIADFDRVIPPPIQAELNILKIPNLELETIRQAAQQAAALFDATGMAGVRTRHQYAIDHHLIVNRLQFMLNTLKELVDQQLRVEFEGSLFISDAK